MRIRTCGQDVEVARAKLTKPGAHIVGVSLTGHTAFEGALAALRTLRADVRHG